jgi:hypothetical protein
MHIHTNPMNFNAVNPYSAAAEKAAAAQKVSDTRKKLMKNTGDIDGLPIASDAFMVGQSSDLRPSQAQRNIEYRISTAGKDSDFG